MARPYRLPESSWTLNTLARFIHLPPQRVGLQQPCRFPAQEGIGPSRRAIRERSQTITGRFAAFQAQWLNVHVDFPLLHRLALPVTVGAVRYPGIKIHDPRLIRLLEVLLHGGTQVGGWT